MSVLGVGGHLGEDLNLVHPGASSTLFTTGV